MSDLNVFSKDEERGLSAILDTLIPESDDGRLPAAGALGLSAYIAERAPELQPLLEKGLLALDALAEARGARCFAALSAPDRTETLTGYASEDVGLIPALVFHAYTGYYQQRRVVEAIGLEHRPPFPEGFPMEPSDTSLLEAVRQRGRMFRSIPGGSHE